MNRKRVKLVIIAVLGYIALVVFANLLPDSIGAVTAMFGGLILGSGVVMMWLYA